MEGKFAEAATGFHELGAEPKIRQPLLNWINMLEGMALLLEGREAEARKAFGQVAARGPFSEKEEDAVMAKFFVDTSLQLSGEKAIPAVAAKDYDKWTFEGIVFLLYALKDWSLENFDEAVPLFRQFGSVAPEKMVAWAEGPEDLQRLKDLADNCVNDYLEYRPAMELLEKATTIEQQHNAVEVGKAARAKMKLTTKLSKELDAKLAEIGPKVAGVMAEREKMSADELAFDAKMLPEAKQKRAALLAKFEFEAAKQAISDPAFKTEKARDEQALLAKKASWLANFKAQLIEDLNAKGYAQPITSKKGAPIPGAIVKADEQQFYIGSPRGPVPVPWAELSLESAFAIGKSFIPADLPPEIAGFRKWHLGVFASYAGKKDESKMLLGEAAETRPIFAEELPLFANPTETW